MLPFILLRLLWRSRKLADYRHHWLQRFGFAPKLKESIWVHAVSVGESISAIPLIKELQKKYQHIIVTNMTPTGAARVKATFGNSITHSFIPYDLPDMVNRFLTRVQPKMVVIMETELWPNLFIACKKRHIPIYLLNARLSEKSARAYRWIPSLCHSMFVALKGVAAQSQQDAERFMHLGLPKNKIIVSGNLKFDLAIPADLIEKATAFRQQLTNSPIWVAASTHPGEEEKILNAHKKILERFPDCLLILVPRHPNRFNDVEKIIEKNKLTFARRSNSQQKKVQVYLADSMGEMMLFYEAADIAFVAGSLVPVGGHNMLEPAALGKPIITGSYLFNFAEASRLLVAANGMIIVESENQLAEQVLHFFAHPHIQQKIGENARQVVLANQGALQRQLDLINSYEIINTV